jgi:hypothetical protein
MTIGSRRFTVNGIERIMDTVPFVTNGRTMVPLRFISGALGADVRWVSAARTATIELDGIVLNIVPSELLPGMDVAAVIVNGRIMVPLRFVLEELGAELDRHAAPGIILITR